MPRGRKCLGCRRSVGAWSSSLMMTLAWCSLDTYSTQPSCSLAQKPASVLLASSSSGWNGLSLFSPLARRMLTSPRPHRANDPTGVLSFCLMSMTSNTCRFSKATSLRDADGSSSALSRTLMVTVRWLRTHSATYCDDKLMTKVRKKKPMLIKTPTAVPTQFVEERCGRENWRAPMQPWNKLSSAAKKTKASATCISVL